MLTFNSRRSFQVRTWYHSGAHPMMIRDSLAPHLHERQPNHSAVSCPSENQMIALQRFRDTILSALERCALQSRF